MRRYAHEQYGRLAKQVLNHWGITSTGDFGEIVFNLIEIGQMRKTPDDRREDFDDVFDFDEAFEHGFQISAGRLRGAAAVSRRAASRRRDRAAPPPAVERADRRRRLVKRPGSSPFVQPLLLGVDAFSGRHGLAA